MEDEDDIAVGRKPLLGDESGELEEDGGVTVVSATVSNRQGINVATDGYGGIGRLRTPHSYHAKTTNIGVNVVGVTLLKLAGDEVVGVPFLARDAGVSV